MVSLAGLEPAPDGFVDRCPIRLGDREMAEGVGVEPTRDRSSTVFETAAVASFRLDPPGRAARAGIEPATARVKAGLAMPADHHALERMTGLEPAAFWLEARCSFP